MRVLIVTIDRSYRVAPHYFTDVYKMFEMIADVDYIIRPVDRLEGRLIEACVRGRCRPAPMIDPEVASSYDLVYTDTLYAFLQEEWDSINTTKAFKLLDLHQGPVPIYVRRALNEFKFDVCIATYKRASLKAIPRLKRTKLIWLPLAIDPTVFKNYGQKKQIGCLLTGNVKNAAYVLRQKALKELRRAAFFKHIHRPKEIVDRKNKPWPSGPTYAEVLNTAKIAITCTSKYQYPILKLFEIPACKTALCCNYIEEMKELGFVPDHNMITYDRSTRLLPYITEYLGNERKLRRITENGHKLVHERHTLSVRTKELHESLLKL
jgi:hypothetical protein